MAINKREKKIDWHHSFDDIRLGTNYPIYHNRKLFQKDLENRLHIFELVENQENTNENI